jgi:Xaa-Pro aminopeptidase
MNKGASRIEALAGELKRSGARAFLASSPITMGYLHGFFEEGGERLLILAVNADGRTRMICPGLTETQARRCGLQDIRAWRDGEDPLILMHDLAKDWDLETARIAVDDDLAAARLLELQRLLPQACFQAGQSCLSALMRVKGEEEIQLLREAGRIADAAFQSVLGRIHVGQTETDVAGMVLEAMRRLGGVPAFCIAATGANSAEPHHHSDGTPLQAGDSLILDFGCSVSGYLSDITRTVSMGRASRELRDVYGHVLEAHRKARAAIREGLPCQEIDRAARRVIVQAGYGPQFMHRTGHGIGLRGHEEPFIIEGNTQPLASGNCFSVEPGIYMPGRFGVRIENCVVCTPQGHESFNAEPSPVLVELG